MGISNTIPPSRLIQPGVIDNAAARPASPFEGQCIFQKDTDQLLVWNGTAWVIPNAPAQNPTGLEFIKSQTIGSSVSSVIINNSFSSNYENYRITVTGINPVASNTIRLMIGSGRTDGHYGVMNYNLSTGAGLDSIKANNLASVYCVLTAAGVVDAQFSCDILSPFLSQRTFMSGQGFGRAYYCDFGGVDVSTSSYTSFTLLTDGNNMSGGTVKVYGYRNS